ncbi:MAG: Ca2+-transporting ATPase, partial [Shewanella psychromarinicola]|uniref:HAD-IC family P-type ATPase n=1 Tax=Shewanella psychromarinicola TaxID=2487742 RepID=UPI003EEDB08E
MSSVKWHSLPSADVLQRLNSSLTGLTTEQAKKRLIEYGHNAIIQKRRRSLLYILLGQFSDFMIIVLLVAAVISGFIGEPQDTIAILVIVLLNAVIGTVQEFKAERAVAALRKMAAPEAYVLRDGHQVTLGATELVPGDVVILEAGNIVPADLRLLEKEELLVDESTLTGESHAIEKQTEPLADTALAIGDRVNLVFKSSMITRGRGKGVVVASGMETEIG